LQKKVTMTTWDGELLELLLGLASCEDDRDRRCRCGQGTVATAAANTGIVGAECSPDTN
jgi:hypothetical protein